LDGVLAFKKNARSNPDLLIMAGSQSAEALFNSQRALAKSEKTEKLVDKAEKLVKESAKLTVKAEKASQKAVEHSKAAVETANKTAAGLADEITARIQGDEGLAAAIQSETNARI